MCADSSQPKIEASDPRIQRSILDQWEDIVALTNNKEHSVWGTPFSSWIIFLVVQRKYKIRPSFFLLTGSQYEFVSHSVIYHQVRDTNSLVKSQLKQPFLASLSPGCPLECFTIDWNIYALLCTIWQVDVCKERFLWFESYECFQSNQGWSFGH